MKLAGRFLYAIVMVLLFLFVFDYCQGLMSSLYLEEYGQAALDEENPDYFFFYSSIPDYHKATPIYQVDTNSFSIRMYEIAKITEVNQVSTIDEYVYILVHSKTEDLSDTFTLNLLDSTIVDGEVSTISLVRFRTLNLQVGINSEGSVYIPKELFLSANFDQIILKNNISETLVDANFSISSSDFTVKTLLTNFYEEEQIFPNLELSDFQVFPNNPHLMTDYQYIFWIGAGGYFVFLAITTYFVFFRKKKFMGNMEPSKHLKRDMSQK